MIQSVFIPTLLPNLNDMLAAAKVRRGSWSKYSEMKQIYGAICKADLKAAKLTPIRTPVSVQFIWQEKNKRRDKDNIAAAQKFVLDALVELQILTNDGWAQIRSIRHEWTVKPDEPGVWVVLQ